MTIISPYMYFFHYLLIFPDDYVQTTTLTRPNNSKDIKVRIEVQQIGNMDLHISNLLRGRTVMGKCIKMVVLFSFL